VVAAGVMWIMWLICAVHYVVSAPFLRVCTLVNEDQLHTVIPVCGPPQVSEWLCEIDRDR
jgi:uncharacterized protein (DUF2336 family)